MFPYRSRAAGSFFRKAFAIPGRSIRCPKTGMIGVFRLESQMLPGNGRFECTGLGTDRDPKEASNTAFNFLKAN